MQCRNRKGLAVGCLICISIVSGIIALILSVVGTRDIYQPHPNKYGLVFDAGSSHTSLYVYQWPAHKENDTGVVSQIGVCEVQGSGLSSYADDPAKAGEVLKPCMDEVLKMIPSNQHRETRTLVGATAGMRLLNLQNETKTQQIFDEVSKTLRQYPVNFLGARILDGREEGSLAWVTVNYLLGTFIRYSFTKRWIHPRHTETYGAMDLGGASTQMTFQPLGNIEDKSTEMIFRLYGYNYTIYTHSYLCYGQDQALKRLLVHLFKKHGSGNVQHPCYPKGYTANVSLSTVYNSPCITTAPENIEATVTVEGTGDSYKCQRLVREIFNFSACTNPSCSFNGVYQPPVYGQFYLSTSFPSENRRRLLEYCSSAMYILTLLLDGYKFDNESWNNIHFAKQAGNADVGWTLGYMLNLTNMIPSEESSLLLAHEYNIWVAAIFFIVLSVLAGMVAAPLHCYCRNACAEQAWWT
ncbi:ectonucleoside triphosphate diphosphohydrolase 8 isoform 2-T2 [Leptodactylus fuscus]|uniref:ectonucleoside triphosphate diphosphohydrolase 8 isoform X2 n=1 Tax=Leptodactylus fuscus TaxID=238119 RepID=UPI003F4E5D61